MNNLDVNFLYSVGVALMGNTYFYVRKRAKFATFISC